MPLIPACDIYGTTKNVEQYRLRLERIVPNPTVNGVEIGDGDGSTVGIESVCDKTLYLCERAQERLLGFVNRGSTKPNAGDGD